MSESFNVLGDTLQRHAYLNVWCTPNQDKQVILQPARVTPERGVWNETRVMWRKYKLPDPTSRFHLYWIGQVHPLLLGLIKKKNQWVGVPEACVDGNLIADFYTPRGVQIHRSEVWYRVTPENNLIVAVRIPDERVPVNLDTEELCMRLYTNAYYESIRASNQYDVIEVFGVKATSNDDIVNFQVRVQQLQQRSHGIVYSFLNGFKVSLVNLINAQPGDYIEYVYDGSVKAVVEWSLNSLTEYISTLDEVRKYLLHHTLPVTTIDYQDDVDLFLVKKDNGQHKGVYYHKNNVSALRMVTHRDYAVPTQYLESYAQALTELNWTPMQLTLVAHIRHSGYDRPLVHEHNRIQDLYRLKEEDIVDAMVGIDATVDVWKAQNLENSGYCALMRARVGTISRQMVQEAYGYNAVSTIVGNTPVHPRVLGSLQVADVPVGLQARSTAYEYNADGKLLGWHQHTSGDLYVCQEAGTDLVEMIYGLGDEGLQAWWDTQSHPIDQNNNHRFYMCDKVSGVPNNQWRDVTGTGPYAVINGVVQWANDRDNTYTLVRSNRQHLAYNLDLVAVDGLLQFQVRELRSDLSAYRTMTLPLGEFDLFLNGRPIIENLDYVMDFPYIVVNNKEYLVGDPQTDPQRLTIRFASFCDQDLKRDLPPDVGFVQYGTLSYNNIYDIREDKVNRVTLGGALYRWDELEYSEEDFQIHVIDALNGAPYSIRDIMVPMNSYLSGTSPQVDPTFTLRARSRIVDKAVSDYLTAKIPQKKPDVPSAITTRYQVVSPFFNKLVHDLISGALWNDGFTEQYGDPWVRQQCAPYEYLLKFDPISDAHQVDDRFVVIHPHNRPYFLGVNAYQYRFLKRVLAIYGNGRLNLSSHIRVEEF